MITPVTPAKQPVEKKPATWKFWVMGGVAFIFSLLFWWSLSLPLQHDLVTLPRWAQVQQLLIAVVFFCVMLALFGIVAMAFRRTHFWGTGCVAFFCSIGLLVFFPLQPATYVAVACVYVGLMACAWNIVRDAKNRVQPQPQSTVAAGISGTLAIIFVGISLCYFATLGTSAQTAAGVRADLTSTARSGLNAYLPKQIPGYRGSMTLDQFLSLVVTDKFGEFVTPQITQTLDSDAKKQEAYKAITEQLKRVNPVFDNPAASSAVTQHVESNLEQQRAFLQAQALAQLSAAQRALLDEARTEFLQTFGVEAPGSATMDSVVEKILTRNIAKYVDPYQKLFPPILALSFFFILQLGSIVFRYLIYAFAPLIAWLYRKLGLLRITEKTVIVQNLGV